jgi:hypothetical protein
METHADHGSHQDHLPVAESAPERLGVLSSVRGRVLQPRETRFRAGARSRFEFHILDRHGTPVTQLDVLHERAIHLIVVRRDFAHYQHLHPELGTGGLWSVDLVLPAAGFYRAIADFSAGGSPAALGVDLAVPGLLELAADAPRADHADVAGYRVELASHDNGGQGDLVFTVLKDGSPVGDLEPYLGALGHLVVLREGDLAYLHAHPVDTGERGRISFQASLAPRAGYRLFLEFSHAGQVQTATFRIQR